MRNSYFGVCRKVSMSESVNRGGLSIAIVRDFEFSPLARRFTYRFATGLDLVPNGVEGRHKVTPFFPIVSERRGPSKPAWMIAPRWRSRSRLRTHRRKEHLAALGSGSLPMGARSGR
jgi:hypothetical protein